MVRDNGRSSYSAINARSDYNWPNGKPLAVYIEPNLEHFAFGAGLGAELAPGGPQPDVLNSARRDYGNRVGAWRMRDMFDPLDMPVSVLANSAMYDHAPDLMATFRDRGDEIVGHGRTNSERRDVLPPEEEAVLIDEATQILTSREGAPPKGWLSPWIAESLHTPTCWPRRHMAIRSTGAWTISRSGCRPAQGGCCPFPRAHVSARLRCENVSTLKRSLFRSS